jgi:isocitrate dehydrogenase
MTYTITKCEYPQCGLYEHIEEVNFCPACVVYLQSHYLYGHQKFSFVKLNHSLIDKVMTRIVTQGMRYDHWDAKNYGRCYRSAPSDTCCEWIPYPTGKAMVLVCNGSCRD